VGYLCILVGYLLVLATQYHRRGKKFFGSFAKRQEPEKKS